MPQEKVKRLHFLYGCFLGLLIIGLAIAMIILCIGIYQSGDRPFSREVLSLAFAQLAIPGWFCVAAILGGLLLHLVFPLPQVKKEPIQNQKTILSKYMRNRSELPEDSLTKLATLERKCRNYAYIRFAILAGLCLVPEIYFTDMDHFGVADITADVQWATLVVFIPALVAFFIGLTFHSAMEKIRQQMIQLFKDHRIKQGNLPHSPADHTNLIRGIVLAIAVIFLVLGICNKGYDDVLGKAIKICTECIGLG